MSTHLNVVTYYFLSSCIFLHKINMYLVCVFHGPVTKHIWKIDDHIQMLLHSTRRGVKIIIGMLSNQHAQWNCQLLIKNERLHVSQQSASIVANQLLLNCCWLKEFYRNILLAHFPVRPEHYICQLWPRSFCGTLDRCAPSRCSSEQEPCHGGSQ